LAAIFYAAKHSLSGGWVVAPALLAPVIDVVWSRRAGRAWNQALAGALGTFGLELVVGVLAYGLWFVTYCGLLTECYS